MYKSKFLACSAGSHKGCQMVYNSYKENDPNSLITMVCGCSCHESTSNSLPEE